MKIGVIGMLVIDVLKKPKKNLEKPTENNLKNLNKEK